MIDPKRARPARRAKPSRQSLGRVQASIHAEVNQIIRRAKDNEEQVVSLGPLLLFSTTTGDAWMLDSEDGLALCLARNGEAQPFTITETPSNFGIEWTARYRIEGGNFIVVERPDQIRTIQGYPIVEILRLAPKWG